LTKSVKSYLVTTIHNRCLNYLRDNKKFDKEILTFENLLPDVGPEGDDNLVSSELEARINAAIAELPEKCREVFMLNRFENLKYQEVADKLQISIKTVEAQMSKALQVLRTKLIDYLTLLIILFKII
jgi:RNA polymerase sigma-70 factor, ECF subfamily